MNTNTIDIYKLFSINKRDYQWEQLKSQYKRLALIHHPDKPTGNKEFFNFITESFKKLAKELQLRQSQKSHHEMKKEYERDRDRDCDRDCDHNGSKKKPVRFKTDKNETFINKFNRVFEENRLDDDNDFGYGDKMVASTTNRDDVDVKRIFKDNKISNKTFNKTFEQYVKPSNAVVKYKEPEPMYYGLRGMTYSIIGEQTNDFSGNNRNIEYTDYMKAYREESLRAPAESFRRNFRNEKEYQQYSDTLMNTPLTEKEHKRIAKKEYKQAQLEEARLRNIQEKDILIEQHYQKIHNLLR